jgi:hypothetical protein
MEFLVFAPEHLFLHVSAVFLVSSVRTLSHLQFAFAVAVSGGIFVELVSTHQR